MTTAVRRTKACGADAGCACWWLMMLEEKEGKRRASGSHLVKLGEGPEVGRAPHNRPFFTHVLIQATRLHRAIQCPFRIVFGVRAYGLACSVGSPSQLPSTVLLLLARMSFVWLAASTCTPTTGTRCSRGARSDPICRSPSFCLHLRVVTPSTSSACFAPVGVSRTASRKVRRTLWKALLMMYFPQHVTTCVSASKKLQ